MDKIDRPRDFLGLMISALQPPFFWRKLCQTYKLMDETICDFLLLDKNLLT